MSVVVTIEHFGLIRETMPSPQEKIVVPVGMTVRELFQHLIERYGDSYRDALLAPQGQPLPNVVLTLDGEQISDEAAMNRAMMHDVVVRVLQMPPFIGGG
ncbi:MAG TPA: MoaD/ThiS family protein [Polyangiaceae bacterium]|nr:MAG: hypothetical protein BWY17_02887 [Deltaproteobacteria bacterium ADurb.Bin207]HNS96697.1 MoaD/ThiS family protein [Polyangiaceae bacterium]HNZ24315.1 MoaD/ThiS family protein [Polyangiaceae bacterium]HOD25377.1 MoaD/ThiS family protein [Polyangiaceae bacterium]HOE49652.1 MoaD/ThiS family protein [Polyangiaceae bacterium]